MTRSLRFRIVTGVAAAAALTVVLPATPAVADRERPRVEVIATGLYNPRGITVDDGIYVAEAGAGGPIRVEVPGGGPQGGVLCFGETGAITKIRRGEQRRVVEGLPSISPAAGNGSCDPAQIGFATTGPHDVAVDERDRLLVPIGLGADPRQRDQLVGTVPFAAEFGTLKRIRLGGREETLADLAAFERDVNPDQLPPDSNPYSVAVTRRGDILAVDAGGNSLLRVGSDGGVDDVAVFGPAPVTMPEVSCRASLPPEVQAQLPPAGTPMQADAVPTSMIVGPDGAYYVAQLTGFPFQPGSAKVFRVNPRTGAVSVYASGFNNIIDIAFGPDRTLYVLEIARHGLLEAELCGRFEGRLVKVKRGAQSEVAVPGLITPGGIDIDRNNVYITNKSIQPGGAGEVLKVKLSGEHDRRSD